MSATPSSMPETNCCSNVQDVASQAEQVPDIYICKECDRGSLDAPLMEAPVIDIRLLSSSALELDKLRHGLHSWGCFQAINHGISSEFLDEVRRVAKQFFDLPMEEKMKYSSGEDSFEGYGSGKIFGKDQTVDWIDRLQLAVYPQECCNCKYWPTIIERFREVIDEYTENVRLLSETILKAMAKSLDLEQNSFLNQYGERKKLSARLICYPRCRNPELVRGVRPHSDASVITILLQDKVVKGLQFLKDNVWFNAPIIPDDALVISLGDQAEITSNGIFKTAVHRVLTNSERDRISVALFYLSDSEKEIEPLEMLISETQPRLYKTVKNYISFFLQSSQQGQIPIEAAKI